MTSPILACQDWPTNGHLIAHVAMLGYIKADNYVLDPTYGAGTWWTLFKPGNLVARNRRKDGSDFTHMPIHWTDSFDVVAFDPPYVAKGGRATSGIKEMDERYGQDDCPATPKLLQELIDAGLSECDRVTKKGGFILVKCMDYISSGKLFLGETNTLDFARMLGLKVEDKFIHYSTTANPQPPGRRQVHARRNYSTLWVFKRG